MEILIKMSQQKIAYHPTGLKIVFDEPSHTYTVGDKVYVSATTHIHSLFPKFQSKKVAERYAAKNGRTTEDVLAEWDAIRDESCLFGTNVHLCGENTFLNKPVPTPRNEKEELYFEYIQQAVSDLYTMFDLVETEKIIFSPEHELAGTVDIIMKNKKTGDIAILDWKTNKEIKFYDKYNSTGLKYLSHLDNCNFIHYSLQLNMYKKMLMLNNYFPGASYQLAIIHISETGPKLYKIDDMDTELNQIFHERRSSIVMGDILSSHKKDSEKAA